MSLADLPYLITGAVGIVFLAVGESLGSARAFAAKHHYEINPDQELIALGAANVSSGLFQGFTVDASLSSTATADEAGARTQMSSIITALLIIVTLLVLAPLFRNLPNAVLAAIVIASVIGLMDVGEMKRFWRSNRMDFVLALVALFGVLTTDVLTGLMIAVFLSLVIILYRASRPYLAVLGKVPGQAATYTDVARHPENELVAGLLIVRLDAPLYFLNANVARGQILDLVKASQPAPRAVLFDLGATADLDVASMDMLANLVTELEEAGSDVLLAQVRGGVRDRLRKSGIMAEIGENRVYLSVAAAVHDFEQQQSGKDRGSQVAAGKPKAVLDTQRCSMRTRAMRRVTVRYTWDRLKVSFWFAPVIMALAAVLLAWAMYWLDTHIANETLQNSRFFLSGSPDALRTALIAMASTVLTTAGVVFTLLTLPLSTVAAQYGSRLLRVFLGDRITQAVLGMFVATFVYCMASALSIPPVEVEPDGPQITATVGLYLMLATFASLILLVQHISTMLQAPNIAAGAGAQLMDVVAETIQQRDAAERDEAQSDQNAGAGPAEAEGYPVRVKRNGYIQYVDLEQLLHVARENDLVLQLVRKPGAFVWNGGMLALAWPAARVSEAVAKQLRQAIHIGNSTDTGAGRRIRHQPANRDGCARHVSGDQ